MSSATEELEPPQLILRALAFGVTRVGGLAASLAATLVAARWLGPGEFGRFSLATAWAVSLAVLAVAGTDQLILREIAADAGRWSALSAFTRRRTAVPTLLAAGLAGAIAMAAFDDLLASGACAALAVLYGVVRRQQAALLGLTGPVRAFSGEALAVPLAYVGLIWVVSSAGWAVAMAPAALSLYVVSVLLTACAQRLLRFRVTSGGSASSRVAEPGSWTTAANRFAVVDALLLAQLYGQPLLLGVLGTPAEVARYVVASRIAAALTLPQIMVATVVAPRFAATGAGEACRASMQRMLTAATRIACSGALAIAACLVLAAPWLLETFGRGYRGLMPVLLVMGGGQLVNVACGPVSRLLLMSGNERVVRNAVARGSVFGLAVSAALVPSLGLIGAAAGSAVPLIYWNAEMVVRTRRVLGIVAGPVGALRRAGPARSQAAARHRAVRTATAAAPSATVASRGDCP